MDQKLNVRMFSSNFVRQQNAMARQLTLGEVRRGRETEVELTAALTEQQHIAEVRWQRRQQAARVKHASDVRQKVQMHRELVAIEIKKKQEEREEVGHRPAARED